MELWLNVRVEGGEYQPLVVDARADHSVAELVDGLAAHLGAPRDRRLRIDARQAVAASTDTVGSLGLRRAECLTLTSEPAGGTVVQEPTHELELVVQGGPLAGLRAPLSLGTNTVGRTAPCDILIADSNVSGRHLSIKVGPAWRTTQTVEVVDLGSRNGTHVNARRIDPNVPVAVSLGVPIDLSTATTVAIRERRQAGTQPVDDPAGWINVKRGPRFNPPAPTPTFTVPAPPPARQKHKLPLAMIVGPLVIGAMMFLFMPSKNLGAMVPMLLMSPMFALFQVFEQKRGGGQEHQGQLKAFEDAVARVEQQAPPVIDSLIKGLVSNAPDPSTIEAWVDSIDPRLWERRPEDEDFLSLRAGWAVRPTGVTVTIAEGGDPDLRQKAQDRLDALDPLPSLPVLLPLAGSSAGICGPSDLVHGLARWIVVQTAALHTPRDVRIAAAVDQTDWAWSWLMWLPHAQAEDGLLDGPALAGDAVGGADLLARLRGLIEARHQERSRAGAGKHLPVLVAVLDERLGLPDAAVDAVISAGPAVGVVPVWVGSARRHLPNACRLTIEISAGGTSPRVVIDDGKQQLGEGAVDKIDANLATRVARAMAPLRDTTATAGSSAGIPRFVGLAALLGIVDGSVEEIVERWDRSDGRLAAPVGVGTDGTVELSVRGDGPHALLGGTSGAGKSEMVISLVAALAAWHPPNRLTFLLVDFKGGSTMKELAALPHCVGVVTNLDPRTVARVETSIQAELKHRMELFQRYGVRDLEAMEAAHPDLAPPALLIVFDEFAELGQQNPSFIEHTVPQVARVGRSVGVHLFMATQKPSEAVKPSIADNTNLRMSLRLANESESQAIMGTAAAASLPRKPVGRAYVRRGPTELEMLQVAYSRGHSAGKVSESDELRVGTLTLTGAHFAGTADRRERTGPTDVDRIVEAAARAAAKRAIPDPRRPWLPDLDEVLPLASLVSPVGDGANDRVPVPPIALLDEPARQLQHPWGLDFDQAGHVLVMGMSGAGKSTTLRTFAAAMAQTASPDDLAIYAIDYAGSGLSSVRQLPHCGGVITPEEPEKLKRLFAMLRGWAAERPSKFELAGHGSFSEAYEANQAGVPRVVVLFDGFGEFYNACNDPANRAMFNWGFGTVETLVSIGRQVGIHFALTADSGSLPSSLTNKISARIVHRLANADQVSNLGIQAPGGKDIPSGRAWIRVGDSWVDGQIAVVGDDPSVQAQAAEMRALGAGLRERFGDAAAHQVRLLPDLIPFSEHPATVPAGWAWLGRAEEDLSDALVSLESGHLVVAGPLGSGRTTALATISRSLSIAQPTSRMTLWAPRRGNPLAASPWWSDSHVGRDDCVAAANDLERELFDHRPDDPTWFIVIDDIGGIAASDDYTLKPLLSKLISEARDVGVRFITSAELDEASRAFAGDPLHEMRKDGLTLVLSPDDLTATGDTFGFRQMATMGGSFPPGRGFIINRGRGAKIQVADGFS